MVWMDFQAVTKVHVAFKYLTYLPNTQDNRDKILKRSNTYYANKIVFGQLQAASYDQDVHQANQNVNHAKQLELYYCRDQVLQDKNDHLAIYTTIRFDSGKHYCQRMQAPLNAETKHFYNFIAHLIVAA